MPTERAEVARELYDYIVREILSGDGRDLHPTTPLLEQGILDSFSTLQLLVFVEKRFQLKLPLPEERPEIFTTLAALTDFVASSPVP